jgi:Flp pilus assembly protein TadG
MDHHPVIPGLLSRGAKLSRLLRHVAAADRGVTTIEFAFVAPALALFIIGIIDFGMGLWDQLQVRNAAQAGAVYASINGWDATAAQIQSAVTNATGLSAITASPSPSWGCGCLNTTSGIRAAACGSVCADGSTAAHYVTVSAQAPYSTILPYPGLTSPMTLTATSYARLYP